jgi:hypothetical protein
VLFVADGKNSATVGAFAEDLKNRFALNDSRGAQSDRTGTHHPARARLGCRRRNGYNEPACRALPAMSVTAAVGAASGGDMTSLLCTPDDISTLRRQGRGQEVGPERRAASSAGLFPQHGCHDAEKESLPRPEWPSDA